MTCQDSNPGSSSEVEKLAHEYENYYPLTSVSVRSWMRTHFRIVYCSLTYEEGFEAEWKINSNPSMIITGSSTKCSPTWTLVRKMLLCWYFSWQFGSEAFFHEHRSKQAEKASWHCLCFIKCYSAIVDLRLPPNAIRELILLSFGWFTLKTLKTGFDKRENHPHTKSLG